MAIVYPDFLTISKLRVPATEGEFFLLRYLSENLDSSYEIFFNPYLDGDRPDIIILKKDHGAVIIEVKDWNLSSYTIDQNNIWYARAQNEDLQRIRSPHAQVFRYKTNMFELHLPLLGIKEALNKNFYKVIHPFVYFHNSTESDINSLYSIPDADLSNKKSELNEKRRYGAINHDVYERKISAVEGRLSKFTRQRAIAFAEDSRIKLVKKIAKISKNLLFSEEIYEEFKRRLSPPEWMYSQGNPIDFDEKQQQYIKSADGFCKIKGVAGCGKTSIIAARAISAYERHENVLILTFNITLKRLIRDKISHISHHLQKNIDFNKIEISTYHTFFSAQLNNIGKDFGIPASIQKDEKALELFLNEAFKDASYFEGEKTIRYNSIFIDEIQDYEKEWITIVQDHFLAPGGEMVLLGDMAQNIYQRDEEHLNNPEDPLNKSLVKGFGRWEKLTKSHRSTANIQFVTSLKLFQEKFLASRHRDLDMLEAKLRQAPLKLYLLAYHYYDDKQMDKVFYLLDNYIKKHKLVPNDIAIISSKIDVLRTINDLFLEKTMTMFVTNEEIEECKKNKLQDIKKVERRKKNFFMQNSGLIKLSTIHSFKGMESDTVFCILHGDEDPEMVYSAITRAKKNLVIFDKNNSIYADFFSREFKIA